MVKSSGPIALARGRTCRFLQAHAAGEPTPPGRRLPADGRTNDNRARVKQRPCGNVQADRLWS